MTPAEALPLRFGGRRPAEGTMIVFLTGARPPGPHPDDWWSLPRDSVEFQAALRAVLDCHESMDPLPSYETELIEAHHDA
jgi:hypothetical protein